MLRGFLWYVSILYVEENCWESSPYLLASYP